MLQARAMKLSIGALSIALGAFLLVIQRQRANAGSRVQPIPTVEPETQKFLDQLAAQGSPPLYKMTPDQARAVLTRIQSGRVARSPADIKDLRLPVGPTGQTRIRIVRPPGVGGALPVVMYFHGGGWILGDAQTHDRLIRELANGASAALVFVDYDRSPEAKYPTAIEQAYAATKYVAEHGQELGVDPSRIVVAGDSVGGNMATVVAMLAKERGGPAIAHQIMFYPVTDANFDTPSYQRFANGPWLTKPAMQWFWDAYLPDKAARRDPHASPLQASLEQLRGLPPALIIVDENDVLRDEGEAYAHKLAQAGVRVTAMRALGTIHDFVLLDPIANTPAPRAAMQLAEDTLRQTFARERSAPKSASR
jgi:acetyl esterase